MLTRSASKKTTQSLDKEKNNVKVSQKDILRTRPSKEKSKVELHIEKNEKQQRRTSLAKNNSSKKGQNSTSKTKSIKKDKHCSKSSESNVELSDLNCTTHENGGSNKSNSIKKDKVSNAKKKLFDSESCINKHNSTDLNGSGSENISNEINDLPDCNHKSDNLNAENNFFTCQNVTASSPCEQSNVKTRHQNNVEIRSWNNSVLSSGQITENDATLLNSASCNRNILDNEITEVTDSNSSIMESNMNEKIDTKKSFSPIKENVLDFIEKNEDDSKNEIDNSNVESGCGSNEKIVEKYSLGNDFRNENSIENLNVDNNNGISEFCEGEEIKMKNSSESERDSGNEKGENSIGNSDSKKSNSTNDSEENADGATQLKNKNHSRVYNLDENASKEYIVDKSVSEMADKLNFSEILKKFKMKQKSDSKIIITDEDETTMNEDDEIEMGTDKSEEKFEKISTENGDEDEDRGKKSETVKFNSNEENSSKDDRNSFESALLVATEKAEMESDEIQRKNKILLEGELHHPLEIPPEFDSEKQILNDEKTDEKITDLNGAKSDFPLETVQFNSNEVKNELNTEEVKKIKLNDLNSFRLDQSKKRNRHPEMGPEFKKKKMEKNNQKRKKEKPSSNSKESTSSGSRIKKSNKKSQNRKPETVENSKKKHFEEDGYIPLAVSGSTKFTLGKLDSVKPFQKHEAVSLKEKLLFGSRTKRFASSKCLEVLKLKKETALKIS